MGARLIPTDHHAVFAVEEEGGLRPGAARWLGFDVICECGHDEGLHGPGRMICAVLDCECGEFKERKSDE